MPRLIVALILCASVALPALAAEGPADARPAFAPT